jgi:hypothetical protein
MRRRRPTSKPAAAAAFGESENCRYIPICSLMAAKPGRDSGRSREENTAIALWYKFGQSFSIRPKFKQYGRRSKFANVMVAASALKKT